MLWLYRFFNGYVKVKIEGDFPERLINKCVKSSIILWNIKYLKTKDILNYYYEKFTETNYDITRSDLKEFFKDQMEIEKKKQNDNEM